MTPQCAASWSRFQLINATGVSVVAGAEGSIRLQLPWGVSVVATAAYAWGEGPSTEAGVTARVLAWRPRMMRSSIARCVSF